MASSPPPDYSTWTSAQLIVRVASLEHQLRIQTAAHANSFQMHQSLAQLEQRLDEHSLGSSDAESQPAPLYSGPREHSGLPTRGNREHSSILTRDYREYSTPSTQDAGEDSNLSTHANHGKSIISARSNHEHASPSTGATREYSDLLWRTNRDSSTFSTQADSSRSTPDNREYSSSSTSDNRGYLGLSRSDTREFSNHLTPDTNFKQKQRASREFDPSRYNTRQIALKIAYFGRNYNGFEWHSNNVTPLPTVEEELWKALSKTKLIFPEGGAPEGEVNWRGTDYSKCGRTDKGVSAFGQVIGLRVRSARPKTDLPSVSNGIEGEKLEGSRTERRLDFDHINDELEYPKMLNRVLPDDIRILAWCPNPPQDFSARFACKERRYRYFFTQPAFAPRSGIAGLKAEHHERVRRHGWLDLAKMREAAKLFEGTHDFRNFCKIDPSRQVTNYRRHIFYSAIDEYDGSSSMPLFVERQAFGGSTRSGHQFVSKPQVYTFTVHGSAFLWHQIRCMVAVLFMIGQGLEEPPVITELLDVEQNPSKPVYEMADEAPLVLWDCIYSDPEDGPDREDGLEWVFPDEQIPAGPVRSTSDGRHGPNGINEVLWSGWRRKKIDEVLAASLLDIVAVQGWIEPAKTSEDGALLEYAEVIAAMMQPCRVFEGGDSARTRGAHVPLLERERMESSEKQNAKYAAKKGISPRNSMLGTR